MTVTVLGRPRWLGALLTINVKYHDYGQDSKIVNVGAKSDDGWLGPEDLHGGRVRRLGTVQMPPPACTGGIMTPRYRSGYSLPFPRPPASPAERN